MRRIILFFFVCIGTLSLNAQDIPQYSLYMTNNFLINPAIAGIENLADLKVGYRNQWSGFSGAPTTTYVSFHTPMLRDKRNKYRYKNNNQPQTGDDRFSANKKRLHGASITRHGLGGLVLVDKIGAFEKLQISAAYAYHKNLTKELNISAGLSAGYIRNTVNIGQINFGTPDNVTGDNLSSSGLSLSVGTWLYSSKYYIGISTIQRFSNDIALATETLSFGRRHYLITSGYKFLLSPRFTAIPSVLVKYASDDAALAADFNVLFEYNNRFWVGVNYRHADALGYIVGFDISDFLDLEYAFDYTTSGLNKYGNNTHEISLGFKIGGYNSSNSHFFRSY